MAQTVEAAVAALYRGTYPRLVSVVGAICRDRDTAEEAVQNAFVRLIGRWESVSRYDDPEAWVRRAALGFASKRRRKMRNGLRALHLLGPPRHVDPGVVEHLDLAAGIAALPRGQREVVVLRHLGLDLAAIGVELGIPEGTVKSRLSRARESLAAHIREDVTGRG